MLRKNAGWNGVKRIGVDVVSKRKGHQNFATVIGNLEMGKFIEVIDRLQ